MEYVTIALTREQRCRVSPEDADLGQFHWSFNGRYAARCKKNRSEYMHRAILARVLGRELVRGEETDHINGDSLDNRRENLRLATHAENIRNQKLNAANTSGYKGVVWLKDRRCWRAGIKINQQFHHIGYFKTAEEASVAYERAAQQYFGEWRRQAPGEAQSA